MNKKELAQFIGILLGDGHLHKTHNCITIVGSLEDYHYYKNYVIPLISKLFSVEPKLRKRNDRNAFYIMFYSKKVMDFLTNEVGLIRGNKFYAVIPPIINDNIELIPHFLRGLFDTDGCLKFSKQNKNISYYPRIQYAFQSSDFARSIKPLLEKLNFNVSTWEEIRFNGLIYYQISGKNNLEKWIKLVNMSNPVHKTKYLYWKKFGFYIPKSSLKSRLKALNLNIGA